MKFIVSSTVLLKNLQSISGVQNTNNTLPILDDFLFELTEEALIISASDLETTMTVRVELIKSEKPGSIAIPAKILLDTLKTFSDIPITFTIDTGNGQVEISAADGKYKLTGHKSDEFPKIPVLENAEKLVIDSSVLANAINKTLFATGNDDLRPVMSGVYCSLAPEGYIFVATDAHKLVKYQFNKATGLEKQTSFILPKKPLNQLKNILSYNDVPVTIEYNQTNAFFSFDHVNLICRLVEGKYPNYSAVIPTENPNKLTIERVPFLNSIKRVAIFANQSTYQVRFKISGQELVLSSEDLDFANEAKERLACQYQGEDMSIGFNSRFVLEMLNNLNSGEVMIEMSAPNRAGILTPVEKDHEEEDILMLIMPVMLNS